MAPLLICGALFILGYLRPRKTGWAFLATAPFLVDLSNLILYYDPGLPLRYHQAMFAAGLGVACSPPNKARIWQVVRTVRPVMFFVAFVVMEICYGLVQPDETLFRWFGLQQYPLYVATMVLAFSLVRDQSDLERFGRVIAVSAALIAFLALIESVTGYNLSHHLCAINYSSCKIGGLHWAPATLRYGYYEAAPTGTLARYAGFSGEPNRTAIVLAMYLTVFYYPFFIAAPTRLRRSWRNLAAFTLLAFFVFVLLLSQVRAAIFAFATATVAILAVQRKVQRLATAGLCLGLVLVVASSDARDWLTGFASNRLSWDELTTTGQRTRALTKSLSLIADTLGLGVGGTLYSVSDNYLDSDDLTPYVVYFVVGGIALGVVHLLFLGAMFADLAFRIREAVSARQRAIVFLFACSFAVGLVAQLFTEDAIVFYLLLFYATARSSLLPGDGNVALSGRSAGSDSNS